MHDLDADKLTPYALAAHTAIHEGLPAVMFPGSVVVGVTFTPRARMRKIELFLRIPFSFNRRRRYGGEENIAVDHITFLQQNPRKNSRPGRLARRGHRITWVNFMGDYTGIGVIDGYFTTNIHAVFADLVERYARQ